MDTHSFDYCALCPCAVAACVCMGDAEREGKQGFFIGNGNPKTRKSCSPGQLSPASKHTYTHMRTHSSVLCLHYVENRASAVLSACPTTPTEYVVLQIDKQKEMFECLLQQPRETVCVDFIPFKSIV